MNVFKRLKIYLIKRYKRLNRYMQRNVISLLVIIFFTLALMTLHSMLIHKPKPVESDWKNIVESDTLRVLTMYSSTSYFLYRNEEMGYEFELIRAFAESEGLETKVIACQRSEEMIAKLIAGEGDVIAFPIPMNKKNTDLIFCGRNYETYQTLIQRKPVKRRRTKKDANEPNEELVTNVTDLIGRTVHVVRGSRYEERMINLNKEIGGGINLVIDSNDSLSMEELIGEVAAGAIDFTICDNYTAEMNSSYYTNIDVSLAVSFPQKLSWAVNYQSTELSTKINEWMVQVTTNDNVKAINKRYFEKGKSEIEEKHLEMTDEEKREKLAHVEKKLKERRSKVKIIREQWLDKEKGIISMYDSVFKHVGRKKGVDWQLLAALAYEESRFDSTAVSWAGARGIMQLMPRTARAYGCKSTQIHEVLPNVTAGTEMLSQLIESFTVNSSEQGVKLALAAYNVGKGHVFDARALAKKYEKDPLIWDGNVELTMLMKQEPEYYNDDVCKFGYARGRMVVTYVNKVFARYQMYKKATTPEQEPKE